MLKLTLKSNPRPSCPRLARGAAALAAAALLTVPGVAPAGTTVASQVSVPASMGVDVHANGCTNSGGPYITLEGELALAGVDGHLIFRNNRRGTHERTEDVDASVVILEDGETIKFAKQPPRGGVGGNPHIWLQFYDSEWNEVSGLAYLGRCVQGVTHADLDFHMIGDAWAEVSGSCDNHPGPYISLHGELALSGLNAKLIFSNNMKFTHKRAETADVDIVLIPEGESITFAKQPPLGGVGGNPWIWWQFTDDYGNGLSDELFIGRCNKLGD